ncbi:MAG: helix-turn-helix transcriptional regulator [Clostridia bacterium]|nr:helix-turn-helix transcriptional regulator [Clostridia bacterium]
MKKEKTVSVRTCTLKERKYLAVGDEIIFVTGGYSDFVINGNFFPAKRGALLLTRKYDYVEISGGAVNAKILTFDVENFIGAPVSDASISVNAVTVPEDGINRVSDWFDGIQEEGEENGDNGLPTSLLISLLYAEFLRRKPIATKVGESVQDRALDYVSANLSVDLKSVAEHVGVSPNYLCSLVKKTTGEGLNFFVKLFKIRKARNALLLTDLPAVKVAENCGYVSFSTFNTDFKEFYFTTPVAYRKGRKSE